MMSWDQNFDIYIRSQAIAAAVLEDALETGIKHVYILCGMMHAWEIAWILTHPSSPFQRYRTLFRKRSFPDSPRN
jgi:hypothetical protein